MGRKLVVVLASLIIFATTQAKALGLGDITLESALNQPLSARIELLDLGNLRPEDINIRLATSGDFARFSLDRPYFLESISFQVRQSASGSYVHLSTRDAVREPYLSFVVEARWPSGRVLSEYTVLLDLPAFGSSAVTQTAQPPARSEQQATPGPLNQTGSQSAGNQQTERLAAPQQPDQAAPNPQDSAPAPQADAQSNEQASQQPGGGQGAETITVEPDDTLWDIALQVRPDNGVTVQQTMLALQELNQGAFIGSNINMIRRGQVLRVPDAEQIRAISQQQAVAEVGRQNQLFSDRRNVPLTSELLTAPPAPADDNTASGRGELTVVTADPQQADDDSGSGEAARIARLENDLAVSTEELDRIRLQNTELTERLSMLEEQIASAQEIIRLRDLELARLQQVLAAEQNAAPDAAPAAATDASAASESGTAPVATDATPAEPLPPTVVTMAPERSMPARLLDGLMANSWALLVAVLAIILLLVALLLRRNRAAEQMTAADATLEDELDVESTDSLYTAPASYQAPSATASAATAATAGTAAAYTFDDREFDDELAGLPDDEDVASAAIGVTANQEEEDLLDEADAFIAYERYPEARALLQSAIIANPNRPAPRLKLLELYAITQDPVNFHLQEAELRSVADASVMARVEELRRRLPEDEETDLTLPQAHDDGQAASVDDDSDDDLLTDADELEIELDLEASADVDDERVYAGVTADEVDENDIGERPLNNEDDDDFDFDLDDDYSPETTEAGSLDADEVDDDDEFQLDDLPLETPSAAEERLVQDTPAANSTSGATDDELGLSVPWRAPSEDAAAAATDNADDDLESVDFDFSLDDLEDLEPAGEDPDTVADSEAIDFNIADASGYVDRTGDAERADAADAAADLETIEFTDADAAADDDEEFDVDDLSFLSDSDEASTKLDLARAYIDMGDRDGAREILEEVLQEGTDEQVSDARSLLEKI